jgi:DNA mismatch repair protein MutL
MGTEGGSRRIHALHLSLANQIAAGEVVERPASVAKELLENALDADASEIHVDVELGGLRLVRVRDNGCGIHRDDLRLALSRHATSKISSLEDLEGVVTMGFRGEALPSIASVCRLKLSSRTPESEIGWQVTVSEGGVISEPEPVSHPLGTTVEVCDLFYNTPARRKFLRSDRTEMRHLEESIKAIALGRFDVSVGWRPDMRPITAMRPARTEGEKAKRVAKCFGGDFIREAIYLEREVGDLQVTGWLARPGFSRARSDQQRLYVNGRVVRDRLLGHAVRQAYQDTLAAGRHPAYVLYLNLDPRGVDVNVHPAKHEVRFRESRLIHDFILSCVRRSLTELPLAEVGPQQAATAGRSGDGVRSGALWHVGGGREVDASIGEAAGHYALGDAVLGSIALPRAQPNRAVGNGAALSLGCAIGHLHERYILAERDGGLVLVDTLRAGHRLMLAKLESAVQHGPLHSRPLLLPKSLELLCEEADLVEASDSLLGRLGFDLRRTGPKSLSVREVPELLSQGDVERLVRDLIAELSARQENAACAAASEDLLPMLATHAGHPLPRGCGLTQMNDFLRDLERLAPAATPEHGERWWFPLSLREIEARFDRGRES